MSWRRIAQMPSEAQPAETMNFIGFPHGLNTYAPAQRIASTEASELVNWNIQKNGGLVSRHGITQYSNSAVTSNASVETIAEVNIGGTLYTLLVDANHRLYYLDATSDPTFIGTLEGAATILSYNGVAVILDGSYIKYLDGVSSIKLAYDGGTAADAVQHDSTCQTFDTDKARTLYSGGTTMAGAKFTTEAWDSGYTIDITEVTFWLKKTGSPTGNATVKIYSDSSGPDTLLATSSTLDVSTLTTNPTLKDFDFDAGDVSFSPETDYHAVVEYTSGDASNNITVSASDAGAAGNMQYYDGSWNVDTSAEALCTVRPGVPPKGKFGEVWNNRPWIGGDPDNPGRVWYGNLTHLDWSTTDGGGYLGITDDNADNFEAGAIAALYGNLYVFGKQDQPYLVQISGSAPANYTQQTMFQKPWATHHTLLSAVNDLWFANSEGVSSIAGVQEYGDLRTFFASDPVHDRVSDYWSTATARAGYYPNEGQYWLSMPSYHRVLVCHTKQQTSDPSGNFSRYPWVEHELYRQDLTATGLKWTASASGTNEYYLTNIDDSDPAFDAQPDFITMDGAKLTEGTAGSLADHQWDYADNDTLGFSTVYIRDESGDPDTTGVEIYSVFIPQCFAVSGGTFLMGGTDGYIYKVDTSTEQDRDSIQVRPRAKTKYVEVPFSDAIFNKLHFLASSDSTASAVLDFLTDGDTSTATETEFLSLSDPAFTHINFTARSILFYLNTVATGGDPVYFNGLILEYRRLQY